jgi:hypothetical protein
MSLRYHGGLSIYEKMTIEGAIKKAIEGGFRDYTILDDWQIRRDYLIKVILVDPSFWQSLGKAMAWGKQKTSSFDKEGNEEWYYFTAGWRIEWHRFIDHLADDGTPEAFFEKLN